MNDVQVSYLKEDARPAFWMNQVKDAEFYRLRAQPGANVGTFVLRNVENFVLQQSGPLPDTHIERTDARRF
jgi:hypothetical protein